MRTIDWCKKSSQRIIPLICLLVLLCGTVFIGRMVLCNRGASTSIPADGFQESYDRAWAAREYALRLLAMHGIDEEHVIAAHYGFTAGDAEEYFVAFTYENVEGTGTYGYRVTVDEHRNCTVVAEGESLGVKLLSFGDAEGTE